MLNASLAATIEFKCDCDRSLWHLNIYGGGYVYNHISFIKCISLPTYSYKCMHLLTRIYGMQIAMRNSLVLRLKHYHL